MLDTLSKPKSGHPITFLTALYIWHVFLIIIRVNYLGEHVLLPVVG